MFGLSFTKKDVVRAIWTFIFGVAGFITIYGGIPPAEWKPFAVGAAAAGLSAVKNLVFADGSTIKG